MEIGERKCENGAQNLWENLRRVRKRGGHSTPAASFWRTNQNLYQGAPLGLISSRKLAAALWQLHHYNLPLDNMRPGVTVPPPRLRRRPKKDMDMPKSLSKLRRHAAESRMQHHQPTEKSIHATPTVSPSSCPSLMELASSNPATPSSSTVSKGRNSESAYSLTTSSGLLKFLNRVWSLEQQNVSNTLLIKALKKELNRARFHAKELVREQQDDRLKIDQLMKRATEVKLLRENKEQDRINAAVRSMQDELENDRKLRKHSESLERKLAQEIYELNKSLASISKELEEERMSRDLVEDLCDELACGLIDCEEKLHDLRQKSGKDFSEGAHDNQLILRISQAWLDDRMQVKQERRRDVAEKNRTVDKFSSEIEEFLQSGKNRKAKINGNQMQRDPMFQKGSLESTPFNVGASAPRDDDDDDDDEDDDDGSSGSHSDCFEMEKTSESGLRMQGQKFLENHHKGMLKQKHLKEKFKYSDRTRAVSPPLLQENYEEHMVQAISYFESGNQVEHVEQIAAGQGNQDEIDIPQRTKFFEAARDNIYAHKHESERINEVDSNYAIENLIRNRYPFSESGMQPSKDHLVAPSLCSTSQSPVREWTKKLSLQDLDISETPLRLVPELNKSTLGAKLFKAGTGGRKSRPRHKASIFPSRDE